MSMDFFSTLSEVKMLPLNEEFDTVTNKFKTSLRSNQVCVSAIYKIQNEKMEIEFQSLYESIKKSRDIEPDIIPVYHGTRLEAAKQIIQNGFDPSFNKISMYGKGTYASTSAKVALRYCKDDHFSMIFQCRFIKGLYGNGTSGKPINTDVMDYSGDNERIFVSPYHYGIIPEYLICYYKW